MIEEELLEEMMNTINSENEGFLNDSSDLDDEADFFDNDDHELMNKIHDFENELTQQNQHSRTSQVTNNTSPNDNADGQDSTSTVVPRQNNDEVTNNNERHNSGRPR